MHARPDAHLEPLTGDISDSSEGTGWAAMRRRYPHRSQYGSKAKNHGCENEEPSAAWERTVLPSQVPAVLAEWRLRQLSRDRSGSILLAA